MDEKDERDVFDFRAKWFLELNSDANGRVSNSDRRRALRDAGRLRTSMFLADMKPVPEFRGEKHHIALPAGRTAELRETHEPPPFTLGAASTMVTVESRSELDGAILWLRLLDSETIKLDPVTIRVFRYHNAVEEWLMLTRSGPSSDRRFAWAWLAEPGSYAAIGLPKKGSDLQEISRRHTNLPGRLVLPEKPGPKAPQQGAGTIVAHEEPPDNPSGNLPEGQILEDLERISREHELTLAQPIWPGTRWVRVGTKQLSGRIKSLAIDPRDGNVLYAGAATGGVWKSIDGGATWTPTMIKQVPSAIGALAIAPGSPDILYAGTGEYAPGWGASDEGDGVYKSVDAAHRWELLPIPSTRCSRIVVHPEDPKIVYVAGNAGLHRSVNGGMTWADVRDDRISDVVLDPLQPNWLYVGAWRKGVFKSEDGGDSWKRPSRDVPSGEAADWIKLAVGTEEDHTCPRLVAKMGKNSGELYASTDGAESWTQLQPDEPLPTVPYNEWTSLVALQPGKPNVIFAGGRSLYRSTNGGRRFLATKGSHVDHHQIVFHPKDPKICFVSTDGGVYRSKDEGKNWNFRSEGLFASQFYSLGVSQGEEFLLGGATQDEEIVVTEEPPEWKVANDGEGGFFIVDPNDSNNLYIAPAPGHIAFRGNPRKWTKLDLFGRNEAPVQVKHLAVQYGNSKVVICVGSKCLEGETARHFIFHTSDHGNDWEVATPGGIVGEGSRVSFSPSDPAVAYAATKEGWVYKSERGGSRGSWDTPYATPDKPPEGPIRALAIDWHDPDLLYIGYGEYGSATVFRSRDGGRSWEEAGGASGPERLPDVPITDLVVHPANPNVLFAASAIGVFRTRDAREPCVCWKWFDEGMPRTLTTQLALRKRDFILYASTMGRGVYRRRIWNLS